jgi:hypothetical protein
MPGTVTTPQDVYERVEDVAVLVVWLSRLVAFLAITLIVKIVVTMFVYRKVTDLLHRVETLLVMAEKHGAITDDKAAQIKDATVQAARAVISTVRSTAEEVKAHTGRNPEDSNRSNPTPNPPT